MYTKTQILTFIIHLFIHIFFFYLIYDNIDIFIVLLYLHHIIVYKRKHGYLHYLFIYLYCIFSFTLYINTRMSLFILLSYSYLLYIRQNENSFFCLCIKYSFYCIRSHGYFHCFHYFCKHKSELKSECLFIGNVNQYTFGLDLFYQAGKRGIKVYFLHTKNKRKQNRYGNSDIFHRFLFILRQ